MKKILSLAGVLMVIGAGAAFAGADLGFDDCLAGGAAGGAGSANKAPACSNSALASPVLHMSFTSPVDVPQLGATDDRIIVVTPNTIGSWWGAGATRFGAGLGPSTCPGWYDLAPNGGVLFGPNIVYPTTNKIDIRTVISVATGQEQHILPGSEFLTHTLTIKYAAGTLGNSECLAGAAIGVANLELQQPGTGAPTEIHQTTDVSNCCLFRSPSGETCPSATPTKRATWGSIKALYR